MQKMVHIARSKQFLDTGDKFAPPPVQIRCKNSPVFIELMRLRVLFYFALQC